MWASLALGARPNKGESRRRAAADETENEHGHVATSQSARDVLGWAIEIYSGMKYAEPNPEHFDFHTGQ
jgi:hypothetical protein